MNQIYIALVFFISSAVSIVYLGSKRLACSKAKLGDVAMGDAVAMPIMGSVVLVSLYLAYKFLPKDLINLLISLYLSIGATYALTLFIKPYCKPRVITGIMCVCISALYVFTNHWLLNNILAFALGVVAIETLSIGTFKTSFVLLVLLFFYDIFWVFGTDVMISVASNVKGPVLLSFPQTVFGDHHKKSLLGLGDIVIPGIFIAQTLIFSQKCVKRGNMYFILSMVSYVYGLALTMAIMQIYQHGQPALLYIVPCLLITFSAAVVMSGDVAAAWNFDAVNYSEVEEKTDGSTEELSFTQSVVQVCKEIFGLDEEKPKPSPRLAQESSKKEN